MQAQMSPPPREAVQIDFSIENGLAAQWDEPRIGALVREIVGRELALDPAQWRDDPRLAELSYGQWEGCMSAIMNSQLLNHTGARIDSS